MDKLFSLKEFIVKSFQESQNISDKFEELKRDLMIFISGKEEILKSKRKKNWKVVLFECSLSGDIAWGQRTEHQTL